MCKRYWIVKNTVETVKTVKEGYAAVGWSNVDFSAHYYAEGIDATLDVVCEAYGYKDGRYAGRKRGEIKRFLSIGKGDIVIVPCYKGFYMGEANGRFAYKEEYADFDRANVMKVDFKKGQDGNPLYYARDGKLLKLSTKIGSRHMLLEVYEEELQIAIEELFNQNEDISITSKLENIENEQKDKLKQSIKKSLANYSATWLEAKGNGFEKLLSNLFTVAGYETHILSKKTGKGYADADIVATRLSRLGSDFNEVLYIQAKHHEGETSAWGKEQLDLFREEINKKADDEGIYRIEANNGKILEIDSSSIKYVLVSSTSFSAELENVDDIILIDGDELSSMITEFIDELDIEIRYKLGYIKWYQSYIDYKEIE